MAKRTPPVPPVLFSNLGCIKSAPGALSVLRSCSFFLASAAPIVISAVNSTSHSRQGCSSDLQL